MAKFNQSACATRFGNTGMPSTCTFNPGLIIGGMAVPKGTVFTAAQLADIQTTLQNGLINDTYASRYHLFGQWEAIEFQNEDRQQQTYGYGRKVTTRRGNYQWQFTWLDGAMCKQLAYLQFNYRENEFDHLFIDDQNNIIGTTGTNSDGLQGLAGIPLAEFFVEDWLPKDGTNETQFKVSIGILNAASINENLGFATVDFDPFSLNQVQDVTLAPLTADRLVSAAGGFTLDVLAGCGNANLVELFPSIINNVARFSATNKDTGAAITISTVTVSGTTPNRYLTIDLDATDPDYPAQGDVISFGMVAISTLATAGMAYYEAPRIDLISDTP